MFEAVHKPTGEVYFAWEVWDTFSDPHEEEWVCCPEEDKQVTPVRKHTRKVGNGTPITVVSHFQRHPNTEKCKYGESRKHRVLKNYVAQMVDNERLSLKYMDKTMQQKDFSISNVMVEPRWEEKPWEDVCVEFERFHPLLGRGVAFEVEKTPRNEYEREERESAFLTRGYSLIWIDMDLVSDKGYSLKENEIEVSQPFLPSLLEKFENLFRKYERKLKTSTQDLIKNRKKQITSQIRDALHEIDTKVKEGTKKMDKYIRNIERKKNELRKEFRKQKHDIFRSIVRNEENTSFFRDAILRFLREENRKKGKPPTLKKIRTFCKKEYGFSSSTTDTFVETLLEGDRIEIEKINDKCRFKALPNPIPDFLSEFFTKKHEK